MGIAEITLDGVVSPLTMPVAIKAKLVIVVRMLPDVGKHCHDLKNRPRRIQPLGSPVQQPGLTAILGY